MSRSRGDGKRQAGRETRPAPQKPGRTAEASEVFGRFLTNLSRLERGGARKDRGDKR
jgi:hypothetical protein